MHVKEREREREKFQRSNRNCARVCWGIGASLTLLNWSTSWLCVTYASVRSSTTSSRGLPSWVAASPWPLVKLRTRTFHTLHSSRLLFLFSLCLLYGEENKVPRFREACFTVKIRVRSTVQDHARQNTKKTNLQSSTRLYFSSPCWFGKRCVAA